MGWKSKALFCTFVGGALTSLASGFIKVSPKDLQHTPLKPATTSLKADLQKHSPEEAANQKRYVQIEGKLYEYNPRHTYNVNGIKTFYINGDVESDLKGDGREPTAAAAPSQPQNKVAEMAEKSPLKVYTPSGAQSVMDAAKKLRDDSKTRLEQLDRLSQ
jgi:hypothetical protein